MKTFLLIIFSFVVLISYSQDSIIRSPYNISLQIGDGQYETMTPEQYERHEKGLPRKTVIVSPNGKKIAQPMSEKQAMDETHIDFTKQYLYFKVNGLIEIDRHQFLNDTMKCPIIFRADAYGVVFVDSCLNKRYDAVKCDKVGCTYRKCYIGRTSSVNSQNSRTRSIA